MLIRSLAVANLLLVSSFWLAGCSQSTAPSAAPVEADSADAQDHSGWWCNEHGVPEDVCALCDPRLVTDFKAKGDWCQEHERPDSQCFACHPEREAEFAAQYEAKYGKQPPAPTNNSATSGET